MPIKIEDTITESLGEFGNALVYEVAKKCSEITKETVDYAKATQSVDGFWTNRTGKALEAINGETNVDDYSIEMIVGFEEGAPSEARSGGQREYGQYISNYPDKNSGFLQRSLNMLEFFVKDRIKNVLSDIRYIKKKRTYKS